MMTEGQDKEGRRASCSDFAVKNSWEHHVPNTVLGDKQTEALALITCTRVFVDHRELRWMQPPMRATYRYEIMFND